MTLPHQESISIAVSPTVSVEARIARGTAPAAAVVCHPHPMFGGSMDNNVVVAAVDALARAGLTTARFDFRGVGASSGSFDQGNGEVDDLLAVATHVMEATSSRSLHLVGYSFGAWIATRALTRGGLAPASLVLVSPAVGVLDFEPLGSDIPGLILVGDRDQHCPMPALGGWLGGVDEGRDLELVIVNGADHFWFGLEHRIEEEIAGFVTGLRP